MCMLLVARARFQVEHMCIFSIHVLLWNSLNVIHIYMYMCVCVCVEKRKIKEALYTCALDKDNLMMYVFD